MTKQTVHINEFNKLATICGVILLLLFFASMWIWGLYVEKAQQPIDDSCRPHIYVKDESIKCFCKDINDYIKLEFPYNVSRDATNIRVR